MNNDIKEYTTKGGKKRYKFNIYVCKDKTTGKSIQIRKVILPKPKKEHKEFDQFYSKQELDDFLFWAKDYSFKAYAFFRLLAYSGIRKGEALALEWKDVDLAQDTITIERTQTKEF